MSRRRSTLLLAASLFVSLAASCQGAPPVEGPTEPRVQPLPAPTPPTASEATLPPAPVPSAAPSASVASVEAPPAASSASMPAATGVLPPYPDAWRQEAESAQVMYACNELVYKRGCAETRTGTVIVELTLAPDGKVQRSTLIENSIRNDPALVWRCIQGRIPKWQFRAPDGVSPTVRVTVRLGDRC